MRRHLLGLLALALLVLAVAVALCPSLAPYQAAGAAGLRMGAVLGALWLAWPDLHRIPRWSWYVLPFAIFALIYVKGYLLFLIPAFVIAGIAYLMFRGR